MVKSGKLWTGGRKGWYSGEVLVVQDCNSNGWFRMSHDCLIIRLHTEVRVGTCDSEKEAGT